jgi:hypothetical protein
MTGCHRATLPKYLSSILFLASISSALCLAVAEPPADVAAGKCVSSAARLRMVVNQATGERPPTTAVKRSTH